MKIIDAHTHLLRKNAIVAINPGDKKEDGYYYCVGVHPWYITKMPDLEYLIKECSEERVVAIGECGLDFHRKEISRELQTDVFIGHIEVSEKLKKPMIVHCVKAHEVILSIHKKLRPTQPWIIHGFRQKPSIAKQFIDAGMYLSLGIKFNTETACVIPSDRLLLETDDCNNIDIKTVIEKVSNTINKDSNMLINEIEENLFRLVRI